MNDDEIKRIAAIYIGEYKENAGRQALRNVNYLRSNGDEVGAKKWAAIASEIRQQVKQKLQSKWNADESDS